MGIIQRAENSHYSNKRGHTVYGPHDREGDQGELLSLLESSNPEEMGDNIELSPRTQELLRGVSKDFEGLLERYPQYGHLFSTKENRPVNQPSKPFPALSFIARFRSFLSNPQMQKLAQEEPQFGQFFQEVAKLGQESQQAIQQSHHELKASEGAVYTRPRNMIRSPYKSAD